MSCWNQESAVAMRVNMFSNNGCRRDCLPCEGCWEGTGAHQEASEGSLNI